MTGDGRLRDLQRARSILPHMKALNSLSNHTDHRLATRCDEASIWRGRFVEEFALAEAAVSEALVVLAALSGGRARLKLPHLVGQRFEALKSLVSAGGPFAPEGTRVARELEEWNGLHQMRAHLCHGSGAVMFDNSGRWCITLNLLNFRGRETERKTMIVTEDEAALHLGQLCSARIRLEGQLVGMLAAFKR